MPKKSKSGPPYTDIPKEIYVVVTNPWGMNANPSFRDRGDFNRVASWAQFVLQQAGLGGGRVATIECIYNMGTRDEIILQFEEGTDIIPLLGEHRWANIAKDRRGRPNDSRSTCVFIYNWRNNGDPANHNWKENFPVSLSLDSVPAKSPYPPPSWVRPPHTLINFVLPIPHPPIMPPAPNNERIPEKERQTTTLPPSSAVTPPPATPERQAQAGPEEEPVPQDEVPTNLFKPYEPPLQHPAHGNFLSQKQTQCDKAPSPKSLSPPPKFVKKLDPYELEEDAFNALRSPDPSEEDTKDVKNEDLKPILQISVKPEPLDIKLEDVIPSCDIASTPGSRYQPSQALVSAVNSLEIKLEDSVPQYDIASTSGSQYQPSQALIDAFNSLTQPEQSSTFARPPTRDSRRQRNAMSQATRPVTSKYQPSEELEAEVNSFLLGAITKAASSSSGGAPRSTSGTRATAIKREYEEDISASLGERKRIKIEEC